MGAIAQAASALSASQVSAAASQVGSQASALISSIPSGPIKAAATGAISALSNPASFVGAASAIDALPLPAGVKDFVSGVIRSVGGGGGSSAPSGGARRTRVRFGPGGSSVPGLLPIAPPGGGVTLPVVGRVSTPVLIGGAAALGLVAFMMLRKK